MATGQHLSHSEVRHSLGVTSVRGRRYPLIIFASGVKDLDRPAHALSSLHRSVCETGFASLSRSLSETLAATAVWEYSHYPLDIQMKAKPDHGMDLSGKMRHKGGRKFSANAAADVARPRSILKNIPRYFNRATFYFVTSFSFSAILSNSLRAHDFSLCSSPQLPHEGETRRSFHRTDIHRLTRSTGIKVPAALLP